MLLTEGGEAVLGPEREGWEQCGGPPRAGAGHEGEGRRGMGCGGSSIVGGGRQAIGHRIRGKIGQAGQQAQIGAGRLGRQGSRGRQAGRQAGRLAAACRFSSSS